MSTIATGGFIPNSTILDNLIWQEKLTLMGGMILGALPFTFHYALVKKKFLAPKLGKEVLVYFTILGGAMVLFIGLSGLDPLTSVFYTVSASTTAGFQLDDLSTFNVSSHVILIILMFIGGCGFSTAGGIKIFRLMYLKDMKKLINKKLRSELTPQVKKELTSTVIIIILFPLSVFLPRRRAPARTRRVSVVRRTGRFAIVARSLPQLAAHKRTGTWRAGDKQQSRDLLRSASCCHRDLPG
jgi:trk system potassium uptake protein TrkH